MDVPAPDIYINGIIQYVAICDWLLSLSTVLSRAIHVVMCVVHHSFFFFFLLFRAVPTAQASSQARGQIGAVAAGLRHSRSNAESEPHL